MLNAVFGHHVKRIANKWSEETSHALEIDSTCSVCCVFAHEWNNKNTQARLLQINAKQAWLLLRQMPTTLARDKNNIQLIAFNVDENSYSLCLFWNCGWCACHHLRRNRMWFVFHISIGILILHFAFALPAIDLCVEWI